MTDRKKLIRDYKETPRPMGVYRVRNRITGRSLVGSSVDLPSRLNRHRAALRLGSHPDRELQRDWMDLGAEAFEFEVLDILAPPDRPDTDPRAELALLEQLWLEKLAAAGDDRRYTGRPGSH